MGAMFGVRAGVVFFPRLYLWHLYSWGRVERDTSIVPRQSDQRALVFPNLPRRGREVLGNFVCTRC